MASWKINGVVADSDEEEPLDSHQSESDIDGRDDLPDEGFLASSEPAQDISGISVKQTSFELPNLQESPAIDHHSSSNPDPKVSKLPELEINVRRLATSSSPTLPQLLKVPLTTWDLGFELTDTEDELQDELPILPAANSLPPMDEISKSYVRLSSPLSELLSSLTSSPENETFRQTSDIDIQDSRGSQNPSADEPIENANSKIRQLPNAYKRSFRERAPIQLHPYAMEQEKYRQSLKARGIAPMRLAESQEDDQRRQHVLSSDPVSLDLESQEADPEAEDSQPMDSSWNLQPLHTAVQSSDTQVPISRRNERSISGDDDFPDLSQLLRERHPNPERMAPKSRLNACTSKARRSQLGRTRIQKRAEVNIAAQEDLADVFDVPASPPATSSPITATARRIRRAVSKSLSVASSNNPPPSWFEQDELNAPVAPDLPTPATSAIKPVFEPILLSSESEDDPFASEAAGSISSSSSSSSSSDESVQIRKVSKKIRGVLPASHLRLDQQLKTLQLPNRTQRYSISASPEKSVNRRGVALPKASRTTNTVASSNYDLPLMSDESHNEESDNHDLTREGDTGRTPDHALRLSRTGFAEEEDRIDAMLPSLKRLRTYKTSSRKKTRVGSALISREHSYQPKITHHLSKVASSKRHSKGGSRKRKSKSDQINASRDSNSNPPRLSILDLIDVGGRSDENTPQFIKVAARAARSKQGQGRQSPSNKVIRLANREDTLEVQSVLEDWRSGRIPSKTVVPPPNLADSEKRLPLARTSGNRQMLLQPPISKDKPRIQAIKTVHRHLDMPRKLAVTKGKQTSIKTYSSTQHLLLSEPQSYSDGAPEATLPPSIQRKAKNRSKALQSRPAQFESSDRALSRQNPSAAFRKSKKKLDIVFRAGRKRPAHQFMQLHRFLADDDDLVRPSVETPQSVVTDDSNSARSSPPSSTKVSRARKRIPHRFDANAARYRQPSEPPVLDILTSTSLSEVANQHSELIGLGKYGTRYPIHFDIMPLPPGVFFHESTFIGSGRLSESLKVPVMSVGTSRGHSYHRLGDKDFRWGSWNEDVSSEVGLFFDCVIELFTQFPPNQSPSGPSPFASMEFMINYVQHSISFANLEVQSGFLSRMLEALRDFSSRVVECEDPNEGPKTQSLIETMAVCSVLVLLLLQTGRSMQSRFCVQLEDVLKFVASFCAKLMIHQGLNSLRKLYDDLQYLSFREGGIKNDQPIALSWVILLRVLNVARIPKASFWDITNVALLEGTPQQIEDARSMEQIWIFTYSILPLCEFDDFGVVGGGVRRRVSCDNWVIPQKMLRSIFSLYSSNAKQSPGFNDYCRAIVSRCHYLMCEWEWWKCSGVIGTIFDFFASQKLEHLRNEEVYNSPRFLEELDAEPALGVAPEDRCFHIFLKIVALAIEHLRRAGDEKGIRNLVARILPNHDRQYPKDEAIQTRDLAALRNHHDLLCTLYWASPPDCRPSLSLIQELVDVDQSHKEACLINLRALNNLARYVFTSPSDESAAYSQFTSWELGYFEKILHQYLNAGSELRKAAEHLADRNELISEGQLQETIASNRRGPLNTIRTLLSNLRSRISIAKDAGAALSAFNAELLSHILRPDIFENFQDVEQGLIGDAIGALSTYMDRINCLHPIGHPHAASGPAEIDSQGSLDLADSEIERQMMIYPLQDIILPNVSAMTRRILEGHLYHSTEPRFLRDLIVCWARLVTFVTEERRYVRKFLINGKNAIFENRQRHIRATKYWPLFLSHLLNVRPLDNFMILEFDIGLEWMQIITSNPELLDYEHELSRELHHKGHYLLRDSVPNHEAWPNRNLHMFQAALNSMRTIRADSSFIGPSGTLHLSEKDIHRLFSRSLKNSMDSMQRQLESMIPQSTAHIVYVRFCQDIISHLRGYASNIRPITDFFLQHSSQYWPKSDDPHLYAAGIISYSIRLHDRRGKAPLELFHYLYAGWKNDLIHSRLDSHITCVLKGMKSWAFTEFMLTEFLPAIILVAFNTAGGCLLSKTYLPVIARSVPQFLQSRGPEASSTFTHLINILRMVINSMGVLDLCLVGNSGEEFHGHRVLIPITCHFWISIYPMLLDFVETHPVEKPVLDQIESCFNLLITDVARHLAGHRDRETWSKEYLAVTTGEYVEKIVTSLQDDIGKYWIVADRGGEWADDSTTVKVMTGARDGGSVDVPLLYGVPTLEEVLELWKMSFGGITKESLDRQLRRTENGLVFPDWMMNEPVDRFPGVFRGLF